MAGQTEFDARIKLISKRAARTPAARAAALQRRKRGRLHGALGVPISALVGLFAGWGGMVAAHLWLRPYWESSAEASLAMLSGLEFGTFALGLGPALAMLSVILLGFGRFWHVTVAAAGSVAALQAAPLVLDYWPQIASAPPPGWIVAAFTA